ncbi:pectinesterase, partial [Trifolium pratense]
ELTTSTDVSYKEKLISSLPMQNHSEKCMLQSIAENYGAIAAHHKDSPLQDT